MSSKSDQAADHPPNLEVRSAERISNNEIALTGLINAASPSEVELEAHVDGKLVPTSQIEIKDRNWSFKARFTPYSPPQATYGGYGEVVDNVVVVLLARCAGKAAGKLVLIKQKAT